MINIKLKKFIQEQAEILEQVLENLQTVEDEVPDNWWIGFKQDLWRLKIMISRLTDICESINDTL